MKFPELVPVSTYAASIDSFGGLNKKAVIAAGEFADCINVTNDKSPCLSLRTKRAIQSRYSGGEVIKGCKALFYNEGLGYICESGTERYIYYGCSEDQLSAITEKLSGYEYEGALSLEGEPVVGEEFMEYHIDEEALRATIIDLFYDLKK